jgi:hypothetical protein
VPAHRIRPPQPIAREALDAALEEVIRELRDGLGGELVVECCHYVLRVLEGEGVGGDRARSVPAVPELPSASGGVGGRASSSRRS